MLISIISDIHDHIDHLQWALEESKLAKADRIFCLGDISSGLTAKNLVNAKIPTFSVFGNTDGDKADLMRISLSADSSLKFSSRDWDEQIINEKIYYLTHYPELAQNAAMSGKYAAVFHGHTHYKRNEKVADTLIVNPGELAGYRSGIISFALFDTETEEVRFVDKE